ncbi:MAG: PadR family transcriptional regulator [Promethearchaeota archaeon]
MRISQTLTPAKAAILGLVSEGEIHGYGINEIIEERGMRIWTAVGFSSIYAILQQLAKSGLISSRRDTTGKLPARKLYRITPKGKIALREAIRKYLSEPERPHFRADLGVGNLHLLSSDDVIICLQAYCEDLQEKITALRKRVKELAPLDLIAEAIFDHALSHRRAELRWAETFLRKLRKQTSKE